MEKDTLLDKIIIPRPGSLTTWFWTRIAAGLISLTALLTITDADNFLPYFIWLILVLGTGTYFFRDEDEWWQSGFYDQNGSKNDHSNARL